MAEHVGGYQALAADHAGLVGEQGALLALLVRQGLDELLQVIDPESHVAGLVAGHQVHHILQHRVGGGFAGGVEGGQGQALDHDLHADELHVPAGIGENLVDDALQVGIDRVHHADALLQVLVEYLDVPRLVKGLGTGVQLGVQGGRTGTQLGCDQQRALLTVQELGQAPGIHMQPELVLGFLIHIQVRLVVVQVHHLRGALVFRPGAVPVDVHLGVPVELLAEVVEFLDTVVLYLVVPVVGAGQGSLEYLGDVVHVAAGQQVFQVGIFFRVIRTGELLDLAGGVFGPLNFHRIISNIMVYQLTMVDARGAHKVKCCHFPVIYGQIRHDQIKHSCPVRPHPHRYGGEPRL